VVNTEMARNQVTVASHGFLTAESIVHTIAAKRWAAVG